MVRFLVILLATVSLAEATADDEAAYVPSQALVSLRVRLADVLASGTLEMMPTEVAAAWSEEKFGFDPQTISEIKIVLGMPMGPGAPPLGALIKLSDPYDPEGKIDGEFLSEQQTRSIGGMEVTVMKVEREEFYLAMIDPRTALLTTPIMFQSMAASPEGEGPLAELLVSNASPDQPIQLTVTLEPVRPMIEPMVGQLAQNLPPQLSELADLPPLLTGLIAESSTDPLNGSLSLEVLSNSPQDAAEMHGILTRSIEVGRAMMVAQMQAEIDGEGPVADAQRAYMARMARYYASIITPKLAGDRVEFSVGQTSNLVVAGMLVGLALPAVQAARAAARRMSGSNNLKQIGLALHNHHAAFKKLPDAAKMNAQRKPLLSWRVMILPFIEQQALYEEFHLDEPWDSEHNIKLLDRMPAVYQDPSAAAVPENMTVYQAVVGDDFIFKPEGNNRFRDILDGLSNTIMVVETSQENAVPWTKPVDVDFDPDAFLQNMGDSSPGGFHVLFGDGAVRFITHSVDETLFNNMLTRAGREIVNF